MFCWLAFRFVDDNRPDILAWMINTRKIPLLIKNRKGNTLAHYAVICRSIEVLAFLFQDWHIFDVDVSEDMESRLHYKANSNFPNNK